MKARYRNKLGKIIVELFYRDKWNYIKTLPSPEKLFEKECLEKVSYLNAQNQEKEQNKSQEVPLILINRNQEKDIMHENKEPSIEDLKKIQERILKDVGF